MQPSEQSARPALIRDEAERLAALRRYGVLDTPRDQAFDDITRLVAHVCQTPIALVTFVDEGRQWFKSEVGLGLRETPLDLSFCVHFLDEPDVVVVPDATRDERFRRNPLVTGEPHVRFYAEAPLLSPDGHHLGALCVLDHRPRDLTDAQRDGLRAMARQVMAQLELRRAEAEARQTGARLAAMIESALDCIVGMNHEGRVTVWNAAAERTFGYTRGEALGSEMACLILPQRFREAHRAGLAKYLVTGEGPVLGRRLEIAAVRKGGEEFPVELSITRVQGDGPPTFRGQIRDLTELRRAEEDRRKTEFRFQRLVEYSPQSTQLFHPDGRPRQVNRAFERLFGITLDQLRDYNILRDPELARLGVMPLMERAFAGEAVTIEPIAYVPDRGEYAGQTRWAGAYVYPVRDDAGRVEEVVLVHNDVTEQRQAEEEVRRSHDTFYHLIQNNPFGIYVVDADFRLREASLGARKVFANIHPLIGRDFAEVLRAIWTEPFATEAVDRFRHTLDTGEPYASPRTAERRRDIGEVEAYDWRIERLTLPDGRFGVVCHFYDLSERQRWEAALRESEARFRAAFEQAAVGIAHVDLEGRWLRVNEKLCNILGYPREELVRLTFQDITHPDDLAADLDGLRRLRAGDVRTYASQKRYIHKHGHSVWVSLTVSVVGNVAEPQSAYFVSVVEDITARREAERLLREESEVVETISRVGHALAAELDTQRLIQTITDATTELTGAQFGAFFHNTKDESGKAMWLYTLSGAPREAFEKFPLPRGTHLFGPTLRGEGVVRIDDVTKDARYGRNAPYSGMPEGHLPVKSYLAVSVVSRSGEVLGGLFFGHPDAGVFTARAERIVTGVAAQAAVALDNARLFEEARKANAAKDALLASERDARAEAERASRMKDEFLATLSHELRTPLNAILGWATILRSGRPGEEDVAQGLATIERNARAQTQIIEDLLDMSRIISGKVRLDVQRVTLEPVLRAAVDTVTPAADAKGVRIQAVLDPLAGPISGDPARLQQVFWNLLTNAVKFTPKGGRVQVLLERVNSHLEVSVVDTGEGISPEFLPHVFDRFRQADATTTRRHGGLGLGLSIVKQLVELHGGSVRAKSMGAGRGSTFTVSLPLAVLHPDPAEPDADRRHPRAGGDAPALVADLCAEIAGVKVLIVDDEPDARALVKRLLEDCKAVVVTAASAAEGLEKLQAERPDVLVSDIGMPGEDGYAFIRQVRALGEAHGGGTPAVALTAYARAEDRMRAIRGGFQMHVPKPVEPAELITMVASLAGRSGGG